LRFEKIDVLLHYYELQIIVENIDS